MRLFGPCPHCGQTAGHDQVSAVVVSSGITNTKLRCEKCNWAWEFKGEIKGNALVGVGIATGEQPVLIPECWMQDQEWLTTLQWEHEHWDLLRRIEGRK